MEAYGSDADFKARGDDELVDAGGVDDGAVGRAEVADFPASLVVLADLGVLARDHGVGESDIAALGTADSDGSFAGEFQASEDLGIWGEDGQFDHRDAPSGRDLRVGLRMDRLQEHFICDRRDGPPHWKLAGDCQAGAGIEGAIRVVGDGGTGMGGLGWCDRPDPP